MQTPGVAEPHGPRPAVQGTDDGRGIRFLGASERCLSKGTKPPSSDWPGPRLSDAGTTDRKTQRWPPTSVCSIEVPLAYSTILV